MTLDDTELPQNFEDLLRAAIKDPCITKGETS